MRLAFETLAGDGDEWTVIFRRQFRQGTNESMRGVGWSRVCLGSSGAGRQS